MQARGLEDYKKLLSSPDGSSFFDELVKPELSNLVWVPNPGPQTEAYFSQADEVFYGGQAGGGKTDLMLGLSLTQHQSSLVLRRTNREVTGLADRMVGIVGNRNGYNSQTGIWRYGKKTIELGGCQLEDDKQKYKGVARDLYCVGPDTEVLMADRTYRRMIDVSVGDMVATLEGPRRVNKTYRIEGKEAIELALAHPKKGEIKQIQSGAHYVLTPEGWGVPSRAAVNGSFATPKRYRGSYGCSVIEPPRYRVCGTPGPLSPEDRQQEEGQVLATSCPSRQAPLTPSAYRNLLRYVLDSVSILCRWIGISCVSESRICREPEQQPSSSQKDRRPEVVSDQAISGRVHPQVSGAYDLRSTQETDDVLSCASYQEPQQLLGWFGYATPCARNLQSTSTIAHRHCNARGTGSVVGKSLPEYSQAGYPFLYGLRDVQLPACQGLSIVQEDDRFLFQLLDGVARPTPKSSQEDDEERTQKCSPIHGGRYPHPYKKGIRSTSVCGYYSVSYSVAPIGKRTLYDMEVDEVNHFITKGGIVNKNCFDEISDFTQTQYEFIIGWNRSTIPGQRCRVVAAGNPPTRPEGLWVLKRWAAWLDPANYQGRPAEPGELRWYTTDPATSEEIEVDGPGPHLINGQEVFARSRTFIPATLDDNPDLRETNYQASLDALPAELRSAYRDGNFSTVLSDDPYQLIPTEWVTAAQTRWQPRPPVGIPMCAIGADIAIKKDYFVLAPRHDSWFAPLVKIKGQDTADAKQMAGNVIAVRRDSALVTVDVGGGWGADCYAHLIANGIESVGYMGVKTTSRRDKTNKFKFSNVRTEALWRMREALDPSQPGGSEIALPPSSTLRADLCAPTYSVKGHGADAVIVAESKDSVKERLGRSTDEGDAVIMSWYKGLKQHNIAGGWDSLDKGKRTPVVNRGRRYK